MSLIVVLVVMNHPVLLPLLATYDT